MKYTIRPTSLPAALLLVATLALSGCAVLGRSETTTTATLQGLQDDYRQAVLQAAATTGALNELTVSDTADLDRAYRRFAEEATRMQEIGTRLLDHAQAMQARGASYLVESEKTATACVFPAGRRPEDRRTADLGGHFEEIARQGWEVKRAYRAYQFDLGQISRYLAHKVEPSAMNAITPILDKSRVDADSLKYALEKVQAALERAQALRNAPTATGG